jgi:hypothetical protein
VGAGTVATWHEFLSSLWIREVWQVIRPTFIVLVADTVRFLIFMVMLALGHHVIEWVPASQERPLWLEGIHFYVMTGAWLFLSGVLFVELVVVLFKQLKDSLKHGTSEPRE